MVPETPAVTASTSPRPDDTWRALRSAGGLASLLLVLCGLALAVSRVWVADDAYITFRHVLQFLAGNGLTYNTIDRVEGFTHPLWAVMLCIGGWMGAPLSAVAVTMDILFAGLLLVGLARSDRANGPLGVALLVSCSGFIDFTTSGLETPLTLWLVFLAYSSTRVLERPVRTGFALGLAYLCHPDVALLSAGPLVAAIVEAKEAGFARARRSLVVFIVSLAAAPLAWHLFRAFYYGDFWPNTYYAKNGGNYWSQGFAYIADFIRYAPLSAAAVLIVAILAAGDLRNREASASTRWRRALGLIAIAVHVAAISRVGGDFMGFRLLLPDLAAAAALCAGALGRLPVAPRPIAQASVTVAALVALFVQPVPPHERGLIVNERLNFASAFTRASDAFTGRPRHLWWNEGRLFRAFQECVGEPDLIVEYPNIGYYGVALGTRASLIDGNGLVDREVARNWASRAGKPRGRPGHEGKMTVDYALRRNIHFVRDMFEPVKSAMATDYGILLSLDPRVVCALPGKADAIRDLKAHLTGSADAKSLDTLHFLQDLEKRDGVLIDDLCLRPAPPSRDCSPAGIQRAGREARP